MANKYTTEWSDYTGDYDKKQYDIKLKNGIEYHCCWPNAGFFIPLTPNSPDRVHGKEVTKIRIADKDFWNS